MFCKNDIFEDFEDILCPLGREIKETGWCQIEKLCPKDECQICDQLYYWNDASEQRHLVGFLIWPMAHQGSIYDVKSIHHSDTPPQFPIEALPKDLIQYMIRFMLVADEPITNPQLQHQTWRQNDPKTREYTARGVIRYRWSRYLRPAILATNRTYHKLGIKMLYQYNTFRVTRLVAQANNDWADFCTGPPKKGSDPDMNLLDDFLKSKVRLFRTPGASRTTRVGRSCMIKKLIIEDSDLDSDYYSKRGIAKFPPLMCPIDKQRFVFYIINKFFRFGGKLRELTITMDEEEPGILGQLTFEGEVVSLIERAAEGSDDKEAVRERWANFMASSRQTEVWTKNWHFKDEEVMAMTAAVEYVIVRGTGASGGDLKFRYFRGRTTRRDRGIHVSGNYAPTSKVAKCLLKYFKTCREKGLLRYFPVLSFTGKFDQRRLRDDGTWVSDDNLDDWLAKRAQPALEITDEDGKEGDGLPYYL